MFKRPNLASQDRLSELVIITRGYGIEPQSRRAHRGRTYGDDHCSEANMLFFLVLDQGKLRVSANSAPLRLIIVAERSNIDGF